jgi:hypothetical protein
VFVGAAIAKQGPAGAISGQARAVDAIDAIKFALEEERKQQGEFFRKQVEFAGGQQQQLDVKFDFVVDQGGVINLENPRIKKNRRQREQ